MKISQDTKRKFELINALSSLRRPSLKDLHEKTKIPISTLKRQLGSLREEYGMTIIFVSEPTGEKGPRGYYMITNWGIIDRAEFIKRYGNL